MRTNYRAYQPEQMDLSAFHGQNEEGEARGNQPFHPAMMLKILIYGYATGTFSSRRIAQKIEEDVAFRVLAGGNFPQHRRICDFRQGHLQKFVELFKQVVLIAKNSGLIKLGRVAIDGTKIKANASGHKAMSYDRMKQEEKKLESEIAELLKQAERTDRREDQEYGEENRGDEVPKELQRRAREGAGQLHRSGESDREDGQRLRAELQRAGQRR